MNLAEQIKNSRVLPIRISKEDFIDDFLGFLQSSEKAPLDIINSKIKKFSFCYVPVMEYSIYYRKTITGDFGNTHFYTKQGQPKWDNEQQRYIAKEEIYHETEWHKDSFFVEYNQTHYFCGNKEFSKILESNIDIENFYKNVSMYFEKIENFHTHISQIEYLDMDTSLENISDWSRTFFQKDYENLNKMLDEELTKRESEGLFDCKKNILTDTQSDDIPVFFFIPFGYIEYEYNGETYYFIKSIFQEQIDIKKTIPFAPDYVSFGCFTESLLFILYSISSYFCYKWSHLINLSNIKVFYI